MDTRTITSLLLLLFLLFAPAYTIQAQESKELKFDCVPTSEIAIQIAEIIIKGVDPSFDPSLYKVTVIFITDLEIWWISYNSIPIDEKYDFIGKTGPEILLRKADAQVVKISL